MKQEISELLQNCIQKHYDVTLDQVRLENPPKKELWDYAFGCFVLSKDLKKNPAMIAGELSVLLGKDDLVESATAAWPYINITVSKKAFSKKFLEYVDESTNSSKLGTISTKQKIIYIDYIGVCVWKVLHIGHICTPLIWETMSRVYKELGYTVIKDSHIGDWGIIFWKLITAYKKYGSEDLLKEDAVKHLFDLYVKINAEEKEHPELGDIFRSEFKKLASWDKEYAKLWERFTLDSIVAMEKQFHRLWVEPDYNIWESFYEGLPIAKTWDFPDLKYSMHDVVNEVVEKWIAIKNDDNSIWIDFWEESKIPSCMLQKRDWTHGYLASDLASIKYRKDNWKNIEKMIYFVDVRQQLHLGQTFEIATQAGWLWKTKTIHAHNWAITLKDGAMSTRTWKIIPLDSVLDEAEQRAKNIILEKRTDLSEEELAELSKIIWIGAIKYWYLKKNRESDVIFDWDEFMSFEWNSWPYIQYAYVRARKIIEKSGISLGNADLHSLHDASFSSQEEMELAKAIMNFHSIIEETAKWNYPHILAGYCYNLTKAFSSFYSNVRVYDEEDADLKTLRVVLVDSFSKTLRKWFWLLWIDMPERM